MRRSLIALILLVVLAGCTAGPSGPSVRLNDLDPTLAAGAQGILPRPVLRVGLSALLAPKQMLLRWGPLMDYLGRQLNRPIEIVLFRSYTEAIDVVRSGGVQIGLVSSYAYVLGRAEFGMEALVAPVYAGRAEHQSYIIVRRYSGMTEFAHLKGHTFAYTDPISATGRLYPRALLLDYGESADRFFEHAVFTGSPDQSIRALDQGLVDGAAVDSTVYARAVLEDPDLQRRVWVIATSPAYAAPPVVAGPRVGSELKRAIADALTNLDQSPEGRELLASLQVDRFVPADDAAYDSVRRLSAQVGVKP